MDFNEKPVENAQLNECNLNEAKKIEMVLY